FPKHVEAAGREPGHVDGNRAGAADTGNRRIDLGELAQLQRIVGRSLGLDASGSNGIREVAAVSNAQALTVSQPGASALFCRVELVHDRVVDYRSHDIVAALQRDGDGKERNSVEEIGGAVERVDDPGVLAVGAGNLAALFHQESIGRTRLAQLVIDDLL